MGVTRRDMRAFLLGLTGSVLLGAVAGLIWGAVAPRALFQEVSAGAAQLVHPEDTAFILADAWFCGITTVGGLITGILGTRLLVRGNNWLAAAGLVLGAVAAAFVTLWVGENIGLSTYNHQLATSATGAFFNDSLALGAKSALAFWPLLTSAIVALTAGASKRSEAPTAEASWGGGIPPEAAPGGFWEPQGPKGPGGMASPHEGGQVG